MGGTEFRKSPEIRDKTSSLSLDSNSEGVILSPLQQDLDMANTKSAAKRARQIKTRTIRNKSVKTAVRNEQKKVREAIAAGDKAKAAEALKSLTSRLDKAAKIGVIHKNTADRKKSSFNKVVAGLA
jgi:small subunit ribosomal protein S20